MLQASYAALAKHHLRFLLVFGFAQNYLSHRCLVSDLTSSLFDTDMQGSMLGVDDNYCVVVDYDDDVVVVVEYVDTKVLFILIEEIIESTSHFTFYPFDFHLIF